MSNLMPDDIIMNVTTVLTGVHDVDYLKSKGRGRAYLTAYQILEQLPKQIKNDLMTNAVLRVRMEVSTILPPASYPTLPKRFLE